MLILHQDGLLNVLAGLIVITFGIIPILDESSLNAGSVNLSRFILKYKIDKQ